MTVLEKLHELAYRLRCDGYTPDVFRMSDKTLSDLKLEMQHLSTEQAHSAELRVLGCRIETTADMGPDEITAEDSQRWAGQPRAQVSTSEVAKTGGVSQSSSAPTAEKEETAE